MLRYFLATSDQVLGAFSERMPFFHPSLIALNIGLRGSWGTLGPREIKKKTIMYLSAPIFEDTIVFIGRRYVIYLVTVA